MFVYKLALCHVPLVVAGAPLQFWRRMGEMGVYYDYPKIYFEKIALFAEGNPCGPVPTGPGSNQNCTAGLVSYLVAPANLPALWVFPLYLQKPSVLRCRQQPENLHEMKMVEAALAARETFRFIQRLGRTHSKIRCTSHLGEMKSLLVYVHVRAAQSNAISAPKKGRD